MAAEHTGVADLGIAIRAAKKIRRRRFSTGSAVAGLRSTRIKTVMPPRKRMFHRLAGTGMVPGTAGVPPASL